MRVTLSLLMLAVALTHATETATQQVQKENQQQHEQPHRELQYGYGGTTPLLASASNWIRGKLPSFMQKKFPVINEGEYQINLATSGVSDTSPFTSAIAKWEAVITGDIPEVQIGACSDDCGCIPDPIDDLHICGSYQPIDGSGGVLGAAGPTRIRSDGSNLPATGIMFVCKEIQNHFDILIFALKQQNDSHFTLFLYLLSDHD